MSIVGIVVQGSVKNSPDSYFKVVFSTNHVGLFEVHVFVDADEEADAARSLRGT